MILVITVKIKNIMFIAFLKILLQLFETINVNLI